MHKKNKGNKVELYIGMEIDQMGLLLENVTLDIDRGFTSQHVVLPLFRNETNNYFKAGAMFSQRLSSYLEDVSIAEFHNIYNKRTPFENQCYFVARHGGRESVIHMWTDIRSVSVGKGKESVHVFNSEYMYDIYVGSNRNRRIRYSLKKAKEIIGKGEDLVRFYFDENSIHHDNTSSVFKESIPKLCHSFKVFSFSRPYLVNEETVGDLNICKKCIEEGEEMNPHSYSPLDISKYKSKKIFSEIEFTRTRDMLFDDKCCRCVRRNNGETHFFVSREKCPYYVEHELVMLNKGGAELPKW